MGISPEICLLFSRVYGLFKIWPTLDPSAPILNRESSTGSASLRCRPVGAPLLSHEKRSVSLFPSYRYRTLSFKTRGSTPTPLVLFRSPASLPDLAGLYRAESRGWFVGENSRPTVGRWGRKSRWGGRGRCAGRRRRPGLQGWCSPRPKQWRCPHASRREWSG